jgi:hypothetical protein
MDEVEVEMDAVPNSLQPFSLADGNDMDQRHLSLRFDHSVRIMNNYCASTSSRFMTCWRTGF